MNTRQSKFCSLFLFLLMTPVGLYAESKSEVPASNGILLNADLENYSEGFVQPLNAGVRWLGDPFSGRKEGKTEITQNFGFEGNRAAHVESLDENRIARIRFQRRYDAPTVNGDTVCEFVFRAVREKPADLKELTLWRSDSRSGKPVGLTLNASGSKSSNTYSVDVRHGSKQTKGKPHIIEKQVASFPQDQWIRFVLHRQKDSRQVHLYAGVPGQEKKIGSYLDLHPNEEPYSVEIGDTSEGSNQGSGYWDNIRLGGIIKSGEKLAPAEPPLRHVSKEKFIPKYPVTVDSRKQLFIDDVLIESQTGLTRKLHPVQKHIKNPLIVPEKPWEGKCVLLYGSVIYDPQAEKFRMWYLAWGKHVGQPSFVCYAESDDGIEWRKPNLGIHEYQDSKDNNIVMPAWSQTTVLFDPEDPDPSRRYKAVLRLNGIRGFFSPDGYHWTDQGNIIEQGYDGTTVHRDPVNKKWIAMVKIFRDGKRARGYAESEDFLNWTDTYYMATVDEKDLPGDQMYAIYMFHYETAYFGLLRMYHTKTDKVDIQLMTSRNAKAWNRDIRKPFIPNSPEKTAWDYANNSVPSGPPIKKGNQLLFYYSSRNTLHNTIPNDGYIGLGMLRVDGFLSLDAGEKEGTLTTKPISLAGSHLRVNADMDQGEMRVSILDESGKPIIIHGREYSDPVSSDLTNHQITWNGNGDLDSLKNKNIRLKFRMTNGSLYSFWSE